jgi:NAD(P)-dependent dehydrogenase (short-subunit alcohol dehydrogenase family)
MVGSGAGYGKPNMAAYAASKGGLLALAMSLVHQHIRVNTVIPGGGGIVSGMSLGRVGDDHRKLGLNAPGTVAGRVAKSGQCCRLPALARSRSYFGDDPRCRLLCSPGRADSTPPISCWIGIVSEAVMSALGH